MKKMNLIICALLVSSSVVKPGFGDNLACASCGVAVGAAAMFYAMNKSIKDAKEQKRKEIAALLSEVTKSDTSSAQQDGQLGENN